MLRRHSVKRQETVRLFKCRDRHRGALSRLYRTNSRPENIAYLGITPAFTQSRIS